MNVEDIKRALQFLNLYDQIVLVVASRSDFGYMRRELMKLLGEPRKMIGNVLYYYGKEIVLVEAIRDNKCNSEEISSYDERTVFYVALECGDDEYLLERNGITVRGLPGRSIKMWQSMGLSTDAMLRALQVDGYDLETSVLVLKLCGLLPI